MTIFPIPGGDSASPVTPEQMTAMGAEFWARYLCTYPASSMDFKRSTPAEIGRIVAAGKKVVFNWETDGTPGDGFSTGVSAARQADAQVNDRGAPGAPIIFSFADPDAYQPDIPLVLDACRGVASVIGLARTGLYARYDVIKAAFDAGVITYAWQTYGQSYGQWDSRAQLRQCSNGLTDHGISHDYDEAWAADYGQWPRPNLPEVDVTPEECKQAMRDVLAEQAPSRVPGSEVMLGLGDAIRNTDAAAYLAMHTLTDPLPSGVPGSSYSAPPTAYWQNADYYGYQAQQQLPALLTAVQALEAQFAGSGAASVPAADVAAALRSVLSTLTLTAHPGA
jgi:hypothetical protein